MDGINKLAFAPAQYLSSQGQGRNLIRFNPKHVFYSQGGPADSMFYIHSGRAKLTIVSKKGKEVTVTLLAAGDFVGEESLSASAHLRITTARAITTCVVLRIESGEMRRVLRQEHAFSDFFLKFMLARGVRAHISSISSSIQVRGDWRAYYC